MFSDLAEGKLTPQADKETLSNLLNTQYCGIAFENIPQKMQCYLLNQNEAAGNRFDKWARTFVEQMLMSTTRRQDIFSKKEMQVRNPKSNKIGKKNYESLRAGELAYFLAKDMVFFQPSIDNGRNKPTGLNYRVLQANLAKYTDGKFHRIKEILAKAKLLGNADKSLDNPIVAEICKGAPKDIYELYKNYLEAKAKYLEKCKREGNYRNLPFLHAGRIKWQERNADYYKSLAARYIKDVYKEKTYDKSIELPRGIFNKAILQTLSDNSAEYGEDMKKVALNKDNNIAYVIRYYHTHVSDDSLQNYYNYKRHYKLFDDVSNATNKKSSFLAPDEIASMLRRKAGTDREKNRDVDDLINKELESPVYNKRKRIFVPAHPLDSLEKDTAKMYSHLKQMKKTERALKQYQLQDIILFMLAKDILLSDNNGRSAALENDVINKLKLGNIDGHAISKIPVNVQVKVKIENGKEKIISQNGIKFKDYPKFYNCLYDRRLPSLLKLVNGNVVEKDALDAEFDKYDSVHTQVMHRVMECEKDYYEKHGNEFRHFHQIINGSNVKNKELAVSIRNCFAHLSYIEELKNKERNRMDYKIANAHDKVVEDLRSKQLAEKAEVLEDTFEKIVNQNQ